MLGEQLIILPCLTEHVNVLTCGAVEEVIAVVGYRLLPSRLGKAQASLALLSLLRQLPLSFKDFSTSSSDRAFTCASVTPSFTSKNPLSLIIIVLCMVIIFLQISRLNLYASSLDAGSREQCDRQEQ